MPTLATRVIDPTSVAPSDVIVEIAARGPGNSAVTNTSGLIVAPVRPSVAADGTITVNLDPTSSLSPSGSWYELTARAGRDVPAPVTFGMPSGGPFTLDEVRMAPAPLSRPSEIFRVTPHVYTNTNAGDAVEIFYGTAPAARDLRYRWDGQWVDFQVMIRCDSDATFGPAGNAFNIALPVPADTSLGNGLACSIGEATIGYGFGGHVRCGLHTGRNGDLGNGAYAYFVPEAGQGSFFLTNNYVEAALLGAQGWPGYCTVASATETFTSAVAHGLAVDDLVAIGITNAGLATGLTPGSQYWVVNVGSSTTFKVSTTKGGAPVNVTVDGSAFVQRMTIDAGGQLHGWSDIHVRGSYPSAP